MIKFDDIRLLETSLIPCSCDTETAEKFISALQYQDFLKQETSKVEEEINLLCICIEKRIPHHYKD